jgi:hypothetical protein
MKSILFALILDLLIIYSVNVQQKSDKEQDRLTGPVQSIRVETARFQW